MSIAREAFKEEFGSKVLAEAFQPSLPYYFRTFTPHRLAYQGSWLWCGLTDEGGDRYACLREWKTEYTLNALISRLESGLEDVATRLYKRLNMGIVMFERDDKRQVIHVAPAFDPNAFHITLKPQCFHWKDADGDLELEFSALGPALKYLCPGEIEDSLYMSEFCTVKGSLQGKKVKGFGGIDCAFGTPGIGWLQSKIYRLLEKYWIVWANRYDDQALEYGICFDGEAEFNLGFIVKNGVPRFSGCSVEMERFDDGFPRKANVTMGEEAYTFETTARVSKIKGLMQWANGEMKSTNEKRRIVEAFSWMEFFG